MASVGVSAPRARSLKDAELKEHLQRLRQTDNLVNWWYLLRTWVYLAVVIGSAVWFDLYRQEQEWSVLWSVPVFLVAVVLLGAGQHQDHRDQKNRHAPQDRPLLLLPV